MKGFLSLVVVLITLKVIVTQDDESQDDEPNTDENTPQDERNAYPDDDPNNPDQMNYSPQQNYPPQNNYPPPPYGYSPQNNNYPPHHNNYPPPHNAYPPQNNYPPPPPNDYPPQNNYPPPPPNDYQPQNNYPPNYPPQNNYPPPPQNNYPPPPSNVEVRCKCGEIARKTVVKKDSPNKGREMYVCPRRQSDIGRCNFFQWADQDGGGGQNAPRYGGFGGGSNYQKRQYKPQNQNYYQGKPNGGSNMDNPPQSPPNGDAIQCLCGAPAKKFVVRRDTPNKGREFYCCPRMRNDPERCDFFLWA